MPGGRTKQSFAVTGLLAIGCILAGAAVIQSSWLVLGFSSFLPQADTWQHIDALVKSTQGLDISWLFENHNDIHLLVIPKLVYHADILLTGGDGSVVSRISLLFLLLTPLVASIMIWRHNDFNRDEKIAFVLIAWILLASPMQEVSLLNPACLQWTVFTFTIILTAFCIDHYIRYKNRYWIVLTAASCMVSALTSATLLLTAIPVAWILISQRHGIKRTLLWSLSISFSVLILLLIPGVITLDNIKNIFIFFVQYSSPFAMKIPYQPLSRVIEVAGPLFYIFAITKICKSSNRHSIFFLYLVVSLLFICASIAVIRGIDGNGFNFRFINLPLLCLFSILVTFYATLHGEKSRKLFWFIVSILCLVISSVNIIDSKNTAFYRNHIRLTPIAYSLDIKHWAVVEELPGFETGSFDYEEIMVNKEKLKASSIGIYHSNIYAQVGKNIHENNQRIPGVCQYDIEKVTRINDQPSYGIDGTSHTNSGKAMTQVWITDANDIVIGIGLPVIHKRTLKSAFLDERTWTAYLNPALGTPATSVKAYAYDDTTLCQPFSITLPTLP